MILWSQETASTKSKSFEILAALIDPVPPSDPDSVTTQDVQPAMRQPKFTHFPHLSL